MNDDDDLVNSQARARSLGFLGSHVKKSEWFTTDLIVCQMIMKTVIKMMRLLMLMIMVIGGGHGGHHGILILAPPHGGQK